MSLFAGESGGKETKEDTVQKALTEAAKDGNYVFILFRGEENKTLTGMREIVDKVKGDLGEKVRCLEIPSDGKDAESLVKKYDLASLDLPFVAVVSPEGVLTRSFDYVPPLEQLKSAIVSPGMAMVIQGMQERKAILVTFTDKTWDDSKEVTAAVEDFAGDFKDLVSVVLADAKRDADLVKACRMEDSLSKSHLFFVLNGRIVHDVESPRTKQEVSRAFSVATSRPRGGCCGGREAR